MSFTQVVKDSHKTLCERYSGDWPTASMIAEDIVDNYDDFKDVDISSPDKYNSWVEEVQMELNRQGLTYQEEE